MNKKKVIRSPLFYVGDKYKLIRDIRTHFPEQISTFVEPFVGGGSVFLNVSADRYVLNDIDRYVIDIHKFLCSQSKEEDIFFNKMFKMIDNYNLSCSYRNKLVPELLKEEYKKTYYAHYNKENFLRMRDDYNKSYRSNILMLYILMIYGFNRMLRFNGKGDYNLPVGNVDFNKNTYEALKNYFDLTKNMSIDWSCSDFKDFLYKIEFSKSDFVYLDPPYLITFSEYNKYWDQKKEKKLLEILDDLNSENIRFGISNVTHYKGRENTHFIDWSNKYNLHPIKSNYISYHDNSAKQINEVLVTNY